MLRNPGRGIRYNPPNLSPLGGPHAQLTSRRSVYVPQARHNGPQRHGRLRASAGFPSRHLDSSAGRQRNRRCHSRGRRRQCGGTPDVRYRGRWGSSWSTAGTSVRLRLPMALVPLPLPPHGSATPTPASPKRGLLSVSVPGLLDAWLSAHEKYGILPINKVLAPAIGLARDGFPVSRKLSGDIAKDTFLCNHPASGAIFAPGGRALGPGEILYQRDLADTFEQIAYGRRRSLLPWRDCRSYCPLSPSERRPPLP